MDSASAPSRPAALTPVLRALVMCDIVDSTGLVERVGDVRAAALMQRHDAALRRTLGESGGQLIDRADGVLALFERPVMALRFVLDYQRELLAIGREEGVELAIRAGLHVGDVVTWQNSAEDVAAGAKRLDVEGLAKPVAARLMSLAQPGQILMSGMAQTLSRRAQGELGERADKLRWAVHGMYRFKGVPAPMLVHEAGYAGVSPLTPPPSSAKAWKDLPLWRRPPVLALEAIAVLGMGAFAFWSLRSQPAIAFAERDWVVMGEVRNLTGEPRFDDALDTALRIGLEQSRYVNVVPNLQVQDALRRMERPGAELDRDVGVELAAREGARALLLPSLTEVGSDLRFSIEVVDPANGNTVHVQSADADGPEDVLAAMDQTLGELRASLGESLSDIERADAPLAKITTDNLEALRAYSQFDQAVGEGKIDEASALLDYALKLDPEFAMAHGRKGALLSTYLRRPVEGLAELDRALALAQRLSERERLMLEAARAHYTAAADTHERWAVIARVYPDIAAARHNLGLVLAFWRHEPAQAIPHFQAVANSSHPRRVESMVALAHAQLLAGDLAAADASMVRARETGIRVPLGQAHLVDLALARHDAVSRAVAGSGEVGTPRTRSELELLAIAVAVDSGQLELARQRLAEAIAARRALPWDRDQARLQLAWLALLAQAGEFDAAFHAEFVKNELTRLREVGASSDRSAELHLAYAALLAARKSWGVNYEDVLDAVEAGVASSGRLEAAALIGAVRCLRQELQQRVACLTSLPEPAWYPIEVVRWETALALGDRESASTLAAALDSPGGRGRAIGESEEMDLLLANLLDAARLKAARADGG